MYHAASSRLVVSLASCCMADCVLGLCVIMLYLLFIIFLSWLCPWFMCYHAVFVIHNFSQLVVSFMLALMLHYVQLQWRLILMSC